MNIFKTKTGKYLLTAYGWTYLFWISAMLIGAGKLDTSLNIIESFISGKVENILFALGVFGPLLGFLVSLREQSVKVKAQKPMLFFYFLPILLPLFFYAGPIVLALFGDVSLLSKLNVGVIATYFFSNLITSGTEEFGWRGVLFNLSKNSEESFWDMNFKTGFIWAVWHYPLMVYMYLPMGIPQLLSSIAGFTMAIIGMNYVSNWVYSKTDSLPLMMVMHALNNTGTFVATLLLANNPYILIPIALTWGTVIIIDKVDAKSLKQFEKR